MANKEILEQEFSKNLNSILSAWRNIININNYLQSDDNSLRSAIDDVNISINEILNSRDIKPYLEVVAMNRLAKAIRLLAQKEDLRELGEKIGINFDEVDFNEFKMGYDVELEHGAKDTETNVTDDDPEMTAKIAWAHLKELPNYYTLLAEMEERGKKQLNKPTEEGEVPEEVPEY